MAVMSNTKKPRINPALKSISPGVGAYNILKSYDALSPSSLAYGFAKTMRGTPAYRKKRVPGPTDYQVTAKFTKKNSPRAAIGNGFRDPLEKYTKRRLKREPGPGTYDPSNSISSDSLAKTQISFPKQERLSIKLKSPSPGPIYETSQAKLQMMQTMPAFKIGTSLRRDDSKLRNWLPGPGQYSIAKQSDKIWNASARQSFPRTIREIAEPVHLM